MNPVAPPFRQEIADSDSKTSGKLDAASSAPRYLALAERIADLARSGSLTPGARLPSVREFALRQGVSVGTVVHAYRTLEDRGLVEARAKSGYFIRARRAEPEEPAATRPPVRSLTVAVDGIADTVMDAAADPAFISFGAACPSGSLYPLDRVRKALSRTVRRHEAALGIYALSPGGSDLRRAISRRALGLGCKLDHRRIVLTSGCTEAVSLCLRAVTQPGDVVAIESPAYFGFLRMFAALGLRAVEIPMTPRAGLSLEALELALDTQPVKAVLAVPTLSNPMGTTMPIAAKERLAAMLAKRRIPLIEDTIFNELAWRSEDRCPVKSFDRSGDVMLCGSISKTLAPALRIGWVDAGRWADQVAGLKRTLGGANAAVVESAVADLLERGGYEQSLRQLRAIFRDQVGFARRIIFESFPRGTRVTDPAGGFTLWVDLPGSADAIELYRRCLEERLVIVPGSMFTAAKRYRNCFRLGAGSPWSEAREAGLRSIGAIARSLTAMDLPPCGRD